MIVEHFPRYLSLLRELVELPSVFTSLDDLRRISHHVKNVLDSNLTGYRVYADEAENVIAVPNAIDCDSNIVYLSAHLDTVDADADHWSASFHPFTVFEDERQMVGRGVNDCKAGVAYELLLSELSSRGLVQLKNCIFTFTFKEEGPGAKTSQVIGRAIGDSLPISNTNTYLFVLENNVTVQEKPVLSVCPQERTSFTIALDGTLEKLRDIFEILHNWRPVCIQPVNDFSEYLTKSFHQMGGHICSVNRDDNVLTTCLREANKHSLISGGELEQYAVVPTEIKIGRTDFPVEHRLVLTNRGFDSLEEIISQLNGITYVPLKDFTISCGFNASDRFEESSLSEIFQSCEEIDIAVTANIGATDASIIFASLSDRVRGRLLPIVAGPGCRSQREVKPPRLTHGVNETFDKMAGLAAVAFLTTALQRVGVLTMIQVGRAADRC